MRSFNFNLQKKSPKGKSTPNVVMYKDRPNVEILKGNFILKCYRVWINPNV